MTGGGHNASSGMSQQHVSVPEARENCLAGLKIVFTGVLPHLNRDECNGIAKRYGAEVPKTVSKKTSVVVLGADAGPAKIKKLQSWVLRSLMRMDFSNFCAICQQQVALVN